MFIATSRRTRIYFSFFEIILSLKSHSKEILNYLMRFHIVSALCKIGVTAEAKLMA